MTNKRYNFKIFYSTRDEENRTNVYIISCPELKVKINYKDLMLDDRKCDFYFETFYEVPKPALLKYYHLLIFLSRLDIQIATYRI